MINWGTVPAGSVLPFHFASYDGATGASEAISGLAVTDIEIYKGTTVTQRSSDAGYALIDTDGIDIDGMTGANGFSIDTGDNTDSGFYSVGSFFHVWVSSITADGQTVNFIAGTFRLGAAEATAGYSPVTVKVGTGTGEINLASGKAPATIAAGDIANSAITANSIAADAITAAKIADGAIDAATFAAGAITATVIATGAIDADAIADNAIDAGAIASDAITAAKIATGAITAAKFAASAIDAAALATDAVTEIQSGLATAAALDAVDNFVDTEVAAIKTVVDAIQAKTDNLPSDPADASVVAGLIAAVETKVDTVDTVVDAVKAKTDSLTFTVANQLDANVQSVNDALLEGDGTAGTPWGPA